jgi:hypothetical protein
MVVMHGAHPVAMRAGIRRNRTQNGERHGGENNFLHFISPNQSL